MERKLKPLYFFGDFDPINQGLLELARKEHERTGRPIVFAPLPAEKMDEHDADDEDRVLMLKIALEGESDFSLDLSYLQKDPLELELEQILGYPANRRPFMSLEDCFERNSTRLDPDVVRYKKVAPQESACRKGQAFIAIDGVRDYIEKNHLYYVGKLGEALKSEHRLEHSLSVARLSYEIALSNAYPSPGEAYLAGLFHDIGKHCSKEKTLQIMKKCFPAFLDYPEWSYHQFVGMWIAFDELKLANLHIFDAIFSHATGAKNMSSLAKIVYAADKIDPLRGYDSAWMIEECKKDLDKGFLTVLEENRKYLTGKGYKVDNPMTKECFEYYLGAKKK